MRPTFKRPLKGRLCRGQNLRWRSICGRYPNTANTVMELDLWPGLPHDKRLDLMPTAYRGAAVTEKNEILISLPSPISISPTRIPIIDLYSAPASHAAVGASLYSGIMLYTTHVLDAAVRRSTPYTNRIQWTSASRGRCRNTTQYNETRGISMSGRQGHPASSGAHLGAATIVYQKPFQAAGLDKSIPGIRPSATTIISGWGPFRGLQPPQGLRQSFITDEVFATGDVLRDPRKINSRDYYVGVLDGSMLMATSNTRGLSAISRAPESCSRSRPPFAFKNRVDCRIFQNIFPSGRPRFHLDRRPKGFRLLQLRAEVEYSAQSDRPGQYPEGGRRLCRHPWARLSGAGALGLAEKRTGRGDGGRTAHDHRRARSDRRRSDGA